jgi:hypothetical protein
MYKDWFNRRWNERESKKVVVDNPFVKSGRSYIRKGKKKITPGGARKSYHGNLFSLVSPWRPHPCTAPI